MSVQEKDRHTAPHKTSKNAESLSTPKKRKHDTDARESSKKKKLRIEDSVKASVTASQQSTESIEKKKRKKKSKDKDDIATPDEQTQASQDIELPDVPAREEDPDPAADAQSLKGVIDGAEGAGLEEEDVLRLLESEDPSSFYSTRSSLYLPIPAISLESSTSSVLATHLAPLLLTYFPPVQGIVLAFSSPVLSAKPDSGMNLPLLPPRSGNVEAQPEIFASTADEFGVCWAWLTVTFLVFRPQKGDKLYGWTNVTSEGFVGLVSYNYFQTAVGKTRIPGDWKWNGPSREEAQQNRKRGRRGRLRGEDGADGTQEQDTQDTDATLVEAPSSQISLGEDAGYFADADGAKIKSTLKFRVVDTEAVPGPDRNKLSLQIDGTLLDAEAEKNAVQEDRAKFERAQERSRSKSPGASDMVMSGALARSISREGSVASRLSGPAPARHRLTY
jgi:DNA-directed RNA polymerase I subunit RPA43